VKEAERIVKIYEESLVLTCNRFIDLVRSNGQKEFMDKDLIKKSKLNLRKINRIRKKYGIK